RGPAAGLAVDRWSHAQRVGFDDERRLLFEVRTVQPARYVRDDDLRILSAFLQVLEERDRALLVRGDVQDPALPLIREMFVQLAGGEPGHHQAVSEDHPLLAVRARPRHVRLSDGEIKRLARSLT